VAPQVRAGLTNVPRMNPEAVDAFFRGVVASKPQQSEDYAKALTHYERAVAIDPQFALAHASIARIHFQSAYTADAPPKVFMPKTESAARKAIAIDPRLAEGHVILANVLHRFHWDWRGAETEFRKALDVNPGDAPAHRAYARFLTLLGRHGEATAQREIARVLDPKIAEAYLDEPRRSSQDFDRNIAAFRKNLEKNPTTRVYFQLGSALVMDGQFAEGIKLLEASKPERHARYLAYLGYAYAASGDKNKGREMLDEIRRRSAKQYVSAFSLALLHAGLGENEAAMKQLENAYDEHAFELAQLNITPAFDPLRGEPRFQELVRKLGFTS
jgi:tetratricopeptide (TPR) repeat protein